MNDSYPELLHSVRELAAAMNALHQQAMQQFTPVVQSIVRSRSRDIQHIEETLDSLLDHCGYEPALVLYKQLCRHYFTIDPAATASYVHAYREMWDAETENETI